VKQAWLGFVDSGLPEGDPLPPLPEGCFGLQEVAAATEPLVRLIREFRPHVITTYDENGGYPHPDHIMTHKISIAAFDAAGDPEAYPESGEPWQPLKLYYNHGFPMGRLRALHAYLSEHGHESPYGEWIADWEKSGRKERDITTQVECADFFSVRDRALIAHATQIDPEGPWFRVPLEVQRDVWPTEDFELARSLVDTELPEDDLFTGITAEVTV
jgi:mycothiol S-conjugate amidase